MKKLVATTIIGLALLSPASLAAGGEDYPGKAHHVDINVRDTAAIQRGARTFTSYCLGCHGAEYMRFKRLATDLDLPEEKVEKWLAPAGKELGDAMTSSLDASDAEDLFAAEVPDLTVIARARGGQYLFNYLNSFYADPSAAQGWNNLAFPNSAMPHVLWQLQGVRKPVYEEHETGDGKVARELVDLELVDAGRQTQEEYEDTIHDLVTLMVYLSEPSQLQRTGMGIWVILYLLVFAGLAYALKREYWRDIK